MLSTYFPNKQNKSHVKVKAEPKGRKKDGRKEKRSRKEKIGGKEERN